MSSVPDIDTPRTSRLWQLVLTMVASILLLIVGWFALTAIWAGEHLAGVRTWKPLAGAVIIHFLVLIMLPWLWLHLLERSVSPDLKKTVESNRQALFLSYTRSWLARYLPGRIWAYGGRIWLAKKVSIPYDAAARSMFLEIVFSYGMLTIIGLSLFVSQFVSPIVGFLALAIGSIVIAGSVLFSPGFLYEAKHPRKTKIGSAQLTEFLYRVLLAGRNFSVHAAVVSTLLYGIHAALNLVYISLLALSFIELDTNQILTIASAWAISMTLGWLAFLAPGGLGARDGIALLLFSVTIDTSTAALIVAAARILGIATDVIFVATVEWFQVFSSSRIRADTPLMPGSPQSSDLSPVRISADQVPNRQSKWIGGMADRQFENSLRSFTMSRILRIAYKLTLGRLVYSRGDSYDAEKYWTDRFQHNGGSLRGPGHEGLSADENARMYAEAGQIFRRYCTDNGIDIKGKHVLEIGCGTGFYTDIIAELGPPAVFQGLDVTDVNFDRIAKRHPTFKLTKGNATEPIDLGEVFNVIVMIDVIHHVVTDREFHALISNVKKWMAPEGVFLITPISAKKGKEYFYVRWWTMSELKSVFEGYHIGNPQTFRGNTLVSVYSDL